MSNVEVLLRKMAGGSGGGVKLMNRVRLMNGVWLVIRVRLMSRIRVVGSS